MRVRPGRAPRPARRSAGSTGQKAFASSARSYELKGAYAPLGRVSQSRAWPHLFRAHGVGKGGMVRRANMRWMERQMQPLMQKTRKATAARSGRPSAEEEVSHVERAPGETVPPKTAIEYHAGADQSGAKPECGRCAWRRRGLGKVGQCFVFHVVPRERTRPPEPFPWKKGQADCGYNVKLIERKN